MHITLSPPDKLAPEVPDDLVLWRYLDFPKLLDLLASEKLKMPRATSMEDGHEGFLGPAAVASVLSQSKKKGEPSYLRAGSRDKELRETAFWRERTYISCWNAFPQENAGLWRIYGDDKGVAIKTTWKSLKQSLGGTADHVSTVFYGAVDYRDFNSDERNTDSYTDQYFVKRNEFVHEREFRLVAHDESKPHNYLAPDTQGLPHLASLECDLNVLIHDLVISPRLGSWVTAGVQEVTRKFGGTWNVRQSSLYADPDSTPRF
jgi:hypothetical protein